MTIKTKKLPCKKEVFLIRYKKRTKIIFSKILNKYYDVIMDDYNPFKQMDNDF